MMILPGKDLSLFSLFPKDEVSSLKALDRAYRMIAGVVWGAGGNVYG